ncbi:MAG: sericin-like [Gammaproteobacteria bacterium]|nr:sericin-like [Gammaproteobacteria bacterium]
MNKSAFVVRSHIRNIVLCSLLTFGLAACGADEGSSSSGTASAASDPIPSLVAPGVGVIDRSSETGIPSASGTTGTNVAANTTQVAGNTTSPPAKSNNPSAGAATLDWMPPTENTDGSVLTNLAGYTVYYGTSAGNLTQSVKITNPGLTAYTLSNLPTGTWYFALTSYSSTGIESSRSGVVSTII